MRPNEEQLVFETANEIIKMVNMVKPNVNDVDKRYIFPQTDIIERWNNKTMELNYDDDSEITFKIIEVLNDYLNVSITDIKIAYGVVIIICKL